MKFIKNKMCMGSLLLLLLFVLTGCYTTPVKNKATRVPIQEEVVVSDSIQENYIPAQSMRVKSLPAHPMRAKSLPIEYQQPSYQVEQQLPDDAFTEEETSIKVGATIRSNSGAMPLGDILKKLAALKDMNVSWASDVDRDLLVDVDITATDDFYDAINNLLRQVDYFCEIEGNTIVVRYKETRQFHVAMPFIKSNYRTSAGGNLLGNNEESENIDGTVALESAENNFDIWENIQTNMDAILETWTTSLAAEPVVDTVADATTAEAGTSTELDTPATAARRFSSGGNMYVIDRPIGLITVTAPRTLIDRIEAYLDSLKKELYKQISIDAKVIEVTLTDSSDIGIDWSKALSGFGGEIDFGDSGVVYNRGEGFNLSIDTISLGALNFDGLINAIEEQGDAKVLSNPKISVMNGQPAMISVGQTISYISEIEADRDDSGDNDTVTYTTETENLLSGLGLGLTATILDNNEIVMNLVPVTSELDPFSADEPIEYREIGSDGGQVGLPVVNVREMSTTVRVKNNDTLIIGGLISEVRDDKDSTLPALGSVPVLKYFFGNEKKSLQKKELVILIKPRII